jgi:hypothetical protein
MLTREQIIEAERIRNAQRRRIDEALVNRGENQDAFQVWRDACDEFHDTVLSTDYLWLDETQQLIRNGERSTIEDVLLFLEVDPWYFRSGYLKEMLIESLKQAPLTDQDKARIRQIIISVAAGKNRREFRRFCELAARVISEEFENTIEQLVAQQDHESKGKFSYILRYLKDRGHHHG